MVRREALVIAMTSRRLDQWSETQLIYLQLSTSFSSTFSIECPPNATYYNCYMYDAHPKLASHTPRGSNNPACVLLVDTVLSCEREKANAMVQYLEVL